ncbi:MAG: hypothetical protein NT062_36030 [Proteobacteria bacterium]|nr:hypothetical protein [Pseudomonadota bacterium]
MAKVLERADIVCQPTGTFVTIHMRVPIAEYAATIVLAGLTNSIPAKDTAEVARVVAAGATG